MTLQSIFFWGGLAMFLFGCYAYVRCFLEESIYELYLSETEEAAIDLPAPTLSLFTLFFTARMGTFLKRTACLLGGMLVVVSLIMKWLPL